MSVTINGTGSISGLTSGGLGSNPIITQPELNTNVVGTGAAFSYYQSVAQTLSSGTFTKLTFTTSEFDTTSGMYASSRFTPTVAGYYQIIGSFTASTSFTGGVCRIYKNGSNFKQGCSSTGGSTSNNLFTVTALVYLNGSTDYVEIYGYFNTGQNTGTDQSGTYFQGVLVRAA